MAPEDPREDEHGICEFEIHHLQQEVLGLQADVKAMKECDSHRVCCSVEGSGCSGTLSLRTKLEASEAQRENLLECWNNSSDLLEANQKIRECLAGDNADLKSKLEASEKEAAHYKAKSERLWAKLEASEKEIRELREAYSMDSDVVVDLQSKLAASERHVKELTSGSIEAIKLVADELVEVRAKLARVVKWADENGYANESFKRALDGGGE